MVSVFDYGLLLTTQAIRRQLAAMPHDLYLIRLIHQSSKRPFPGERLWTASQLDHTATVRFLRIRNCEGCDVYIHPYAEDQNAGYILVDLDAGDQAAVESMRANGHDPCVVLQTSQGNLQVWVRVSMTPLQPAVATAIGKELARAYGGDMASTDWRHLGRLAGFTNQKPHRRTSGGYAPWVKILYARAGLASNSESLLQAALRGPTVVGLPTDSTPPNRQRGTTAICPNATPPRIPAAEAAQIYRSCIERWRIAERFPQPDWSIVDLWVVRELLRQGRPADELRAVIQLASPHFPRGHSNPADYLRRTLARAPFPVPGGAVCGAHDRAPAGAAIDSACSNSTGGR
jgi:hypothetical protein